MTRAYRKIRPTGALVYSVGEVQAQYDVCRNTISNWVNSGLRPSDASQPQRFRGAELQRFHEARQERARRTLRHGEFKCMGCGAAVFPELQTLVLGVTKSGTDRACAVCPDCQVMVIKLLGETECDSFKNCLDTNTSLARIDEENVSDPARIGKEPGFRESPWHTHNDRVVHEWQAYAGRYDRKTMIAHLVSIRDFEQFLEGKPFEKVTPKNAGAYRDRLVELGRLPKKDGGLSNSTIRHRASHLSAFFKWLRNQDGFRRLSGNIPDYFLLPRATMARTLPRDDKRYPSIEDALRMVQAMPSRTLQERRDKAMVAFAFVTGLRAGALTSLWLKHLDMEGKTVVQDAREMRAKNGKSFRVFWFPRTEGFQQIFCEWIAEIFALGFTAQDAVFPEVKDLISDFEDSPPVAPLKTSRALQTAFERASATIDEEYSPHVARHTLKALGDKLCRTSEERKAWSLNLGHSSERITETHYGKMPDQRRAGIIENLSAEDVLSEDEKELVMDYYENRFPRGTREFRIARKLARRRENARGDDDLFE
jgi:integrase